MYVKRWSTLSSEQMLNVITADSSKPNSNATFIFKRYLYKDSPLPHPFDHSSLCAYLSFSCISFAVLLLLSYSLIYSFVLLFHKYSLSSPLCQTQAFPLTAFVNWAEAVLFWFVWPSALNSLPCTQYRLEWLYSWGDRWGWIVPGHRAEPCFL